MNKETKSAAKIILAIEDAAQIAETVMPAYIAATRDALRASAQKVPSAAPLIREAADFIQAILAAKHACPSARFAGFGGELGEKFDAEFSARRPAANHALAARLRAAAQQLRATSGIGSARIVREWGQEIAIIA